MNPPRLSAARRINLGKRAGVASGLFETAITKLTGARTVREEANRAAEDC